MIVSIFIKILLSLFHSNCFGLACLFGLLVSMQHLFMIIQTHLYYIVTYTLNAYVMGKAVHSQQSNIISSSTILVCHNQSQSKDIVTTRDWMSVFVPPSTVKKDHMVSTAICPYCPEHCRCGEENNIQGLKLRLWPDYLKYLLSLDAREGDQLYLPMLYQTQAAIHQRLQQNHFD